MDEQSRYDDDDDDLTGYVSGSRGAKVRVMVMGDARDDYASDLGEWSIRAWISCFFGFLFKKKPDSR